MPPEASADAAPAPESTAQTTRGLVVRGGLLAVAAAKAGKLASPQHHVVSISPYTLYFLSPYAVGFVALIFIHEMGHFLAARQRGS